LRMMRFAMKGEEYRPYNPKENEEDKQRVRENIKRYNERKKAGLVVPLGWGKGRPKVPKEGKQKRKYTRRSNLENDEQQSTSLPSDGPLHVEAQVNFSESQQDYVLMETAGSVSASTEGVEETEGQAPSDLQVDKIDSESKNSQIRTVSTRSSHSEGAPSYTLTVQDNIGTIDSTDNEWNLEHVADSSNHVPFSSAPPHVSIEFYPTQSNASIPQSDDQQTGDQQNDNNNTRVSSRPYRTRQR